jgi:hypothetical protein
MTNTTALLMAKRVLQPVHPGSDAFLTLDPGSGMGKKSESLSGFVINNPDHISESLETIFWG